MAEMTPMMRQYYEMKERAGDCILFFRLGDFYEMFDDDARLVSGELDLTLTTRDRGKDPEDQTPMCGVPFHSSEAYIARLLAKGYKVAICEQTEDPALAKGLVSRDVTRIITPGTVMDSSMLEEGRSNYIAGVFLAPRGGAVCFCDLSTGEFCATAFSKDAAAHLKNELARFSPREAMLNAGAFLESAGIADFLSQRLGCLVQLAETGFDLPAARGLVTAQFGENCSLLDNEDALCAAGGLLKYLHDTQKTDLSHINMVDYYTGGRFMELDITARRNLELTETLRGGEKKGSLLWVLDKTKTPMGKRLLRTWLERPLLKPADIQYRSAAVAELHGNNIARGELIATLSGIGDLERLIGRIVYGNGNCRDLSSLAASLAPLPELQALLSPMESPCLKKLSGMDLLSDIKELIDRAVCDDPPFSVREGGMLRSGFCPEVDELRDLVHGGKTAVLDIEVRERERSGIKKLKVGYNRVFGYYIEVPRSQSAEVPEDYIRKQTLATGERFITQELKELETKLLTAKDRLAELEYQQFCALREQVAAEVARIQATADMVAETDVLCDLAEIAVKNNYCRPEVDLSGVIQIRDGRHPVVERMLDKSLFVPNDCCLSREGQRTAVITGPNMAGKSTYMRQVALIVLMAQMGSFVPAASARIGVVDRVFTRIGASDDLSAGQSTFMVEMSEVAEILKNATGASLLILDEIGRGTSTFDGMALARAVVEYCNDPKKLGAKTLFATHYHELTELEDSTAGVANYNIATKKRGDDIIFLRKIVPGGTDDSYGIEVAKLAGVPEAVIRRAKAVLSKLETEGGAAAAPRAEAPMQVSLMDMAGAGIAEKLRRVNLDTLTPIEAMNLLYELKKEV